MKHQWWHKKIMYQIYPKSFCDSNGDGIGDIRGIISRLDYLKELGVDVVWISPIYCSPLADQGYDISDYYNIDPRFGTMDDLDELLAEAKKRDMYIVMDLVVNHTSDEHEWFKRACEDPDGKYGRYYYISDYREGDKLPCNWRSSFGGPTWDKLPGHDDKIYFHAFHKKQPDLNWENPEVRKEIYRMINWWLDKGIAGFRVDAIMNIKKLLPFKDLPADREDGMCAISTMLKMTDGPYDFLDEMAAETFRKHDAFSIGEIFDESADDLPRIIGDNGCFSSMFDFAETILNMSPKGWYDNKPITPDQYRDTCFKSQKKAAGIGLMANIIENHDEPRGVSRYIPAGECSDASKKMLGGLNFMLRGVPFIYQGQELGMENTVISSIDEVDDVSSIDEYNVALSAGLTPEAALKAVNYYSRDNTRTPFQWNGKENAGFTAGTPWLKLNPNYTSINLEEQKGRADSVYEFYRKLIALRKNPVYSDTAVYGETVPFMEDAKRLMAYYRKGDPTLLVIGNFSPNPQDIELKDDIKEVLINNMNTFRTEKNTLHMAGYQFVVLEI